MAQAFAQILISSIARVVHRMLRCCRGPVQKIEIVTVNVPNVDGAETHSASDKSTVVADGLELCDVRAEARLATLHETLVEEQIHAMREEVQMVSLSKEKLAVVLRCSEGKRLTCQQMWVLCGCVALEHHKEAVILSRYAHLTDRDSFRKVILEQFTRSEALRSKLMRRVKSKLEEEAVPATEVD
uniref:DUF4476 domain-containing protein n=1 Tax=Noctiluca scintillans TaxID=2966 RepID=A0A7S1A720_NOCSC